MLDVVGQDYGIIWLQLVGYLCIVGGVVDQMICCDCWQGVEQQVCG